MGGGNGFGCGERVQEEGERNGMALERDGRKKSEMERQEVRRKEEKGEVLTGMGD